MCVGQYMEGTMTIAEIYEHLNKGYGGGGGVEQVTNSIIQKAHNIHVSLMRSRGSWNQCIYFNFMRKCEMEIP